jgi:hypothetical protein
VRTFTIVFKECRLNVSPQVESIYFHGSLRRNPILNSVSVFSSPIVLCGIMRLLQTSTSPSHSSMYMLQISMCCLANGRASCSLADSLMRPLNMDHAPRVGYIVYLSSEIGRLSPCLMPFSDLTRRCEVRTPVSSSAQDKLPPQTSMCSECLCEQGRNQMSRME